MHIFVCACVFMCACLCVCLFVYLCVCVWQVRVSSVPVHVCAHSRTWAGGYAPD